MDKRVTVIPRDEQDRILHTLPVWARERIAALEAERDALREMVTLATSVHTMTDEQLDELRANAQAAIDAAREKP